MRNDGAPDIRVIWDRQPIARRPHLCDRCNEEIRPGDRYSSTGVVVDGLFEARKTHLGTYPSGCPSIRAKEAAELAEQAAADQAEIDRATEYDRIVRAERRGRRKPLATGSRYQPGHG